MIASVLGEVLWHSLILDPRIDAVSKEHLKRVNHILDSHGRPEDWPPGKARRILEVASYAHTTGYMLAQNPDTEVVLTDISVDTLALGERIAKSQNIPVDGVNRVASDFHDLPFYDGQFDLVYISSALHHTWDWRTAITEMTRVLAPGGLLFLENEPCLREFCFYKFRTNRPHEFRPLEKSLEESGLIRTIAEPFPGSRPEILFGMVENQTIPLQELLDLLKEAGELADVSVTPESCIGAFEKGILGKRKSGVQAVRTFVAEELKTGINKARQVYGPHDIAMGYELPSEDEIGQMALSVAGRVCSLDGEETSLAYRIGLSMIFAAPVSVTMRKRGQRKDRDDGLKLRYDWGKRDNVTIGYPENLKHILDGLLDALPNIQAAPEEALRASFPADEWELGKNPSNIRFLTLRKSKSRIICRKTPPSGTLLILLRVYAAFNGYPYRVTLEIDGGQIAFFDVYQGGAFLFNAEAPAPQGDYLLSFNVRSIESGEFLDAVPPINISVARVCGLTGN
jgi:SAM-dependent methyltransferase